MSYVKTVWETGDVITAEKLNNLEDGVANAGSVLKLTFTEDPNNEGVFVCNHTWQEIYNAFANGDIVIKWEAYHESDDDYGATIEFLSTAYLQPGVGYLLDDSTGTTIAIVQNPSDYPVINT